MLLRNAAILGLTILSGVYSTPPEYSPLTLIVRPAEYFGNTYSAAPATGVTHVWFVGEPIKLLVDISNSGDTVESLVSASGGPAANVRFHVVRAGEAVDLRPVVANDARHFGRSGEYAFEWSERLQLNPSDTLELHVNLEVAPRVPGIYSLEVTSPATDDHNRPLRPRGSIFKFELRATSADNLCEIARRAALRAYLDKLYDVAIQMTDRMLQVNPVSAMAHAIRGDIHSARGQFDDAEREYRLAIG